MPRGGHRENAGRKAGGRDPEAAVRFAEAVKAAYEKKTGTPFIDLVVGLLESEKEEVRERVTMRILEWEIGKAVSKIETSGADGGPVQIVFDTPVSPHLQKKRERANP